MYIYVYIHTHHIIRVCSYVGPHDPAPAERRLRVPRLPAYAVLYCSVLNYTILDTGYYILYTILYYNILYYIQHYTIHYALSTILYTMHYTLYYTLYCIVLYCTVLYCTVLYYIVPVGRRAAEVCTQK